MVYLFSDVEVCNENINDVEVCNINLLVLLLRFVIRILLIFIILKFGYKEF